MGRWLLRATSRWRTIRWHLTVKNGQQVMSPRYRMFGFEVSRRTYWCFIRLCGHRERDRDYEIRRH